MPRFIKKSTKKAGTAPGTLILVGEQKAEQVDITLINYNQDQMIERQLDTIEESLAYRDQPTVTWINIDGLHDIGLLEWLGVHFGIHALTLEDIVNTGQRPKAEEFDDYVFMVFKMLIYDASLGRIRAEQISLVVGSTFVLSFQEMKGDVFESIRQRLRKGNGRVRSGGCAYLAYALIDAVVDHYFTVLETFGEQIEDLEQQLMGKSDPDPSVLETIHEYKREMIFFRKQVWPMREMLNSLVKSDSDLIHESTGVFFSDVHDHCIQVLDTIDSFRDLLSSMQDLYLSMVSNRMNEVMKVLTIIATMFIPLTFLAGIYGMNFDFMPELHWKWAYFVLLGLMLAVVVVMVVYFKRKKWL